MLVGVYVDFSFEEKLFLNREFPETFGRLTDLVILHYEKIYCIYFSLWEICSYL